MRDFIGVVLTFDTGVVWSVSPVLEVFKTPTVLLASMVLLPVAVYKV